MSWLGVDIGTSSVKAAVVHGDGRIDPPGQKRCALVHPGPDQYELDPLAVWDAAKYAIAQAASRNTGGPIRAICASSLGESFVLLDRQGRELCNSPMFYDQRGGDALDALLGRMDINAWLRGSGLRPDKQQTLPKLMDLFERRPDLRYAAARLHFFADYLLYKLGGTHTTDASLASTSMMLSYEDGDWWEAALTCGGIPSGLMPKIRPAGTDLGPVSREIADELSLPHGVRLILGGHDQMMCAIGARVFEAGVAANSMGTTDAVTPVVPAGPGAARVLDGGFRLTPYSAVPNLYYSSVYNLCGGSVNEWFVRTFLSQPEGESDLAYRRLEAGLPEGPSPVLFIPTLAGRSRGNGGDMGGAVLGLRLDTTREDVYKALLESQAFEIKREMDRFEAFCAPIKCINAVGGSARSDANLQLRADIFLKRINRMACDEAGVMGNAIVAGVATGDFESVEAAAGRLARVDAAFEPDPKRHERYLERFGEYLRRCERMEQC